MLKEFYQNCKEDGFWGAVLFIFTAAMAVAVLAMVLYILFILVNCSFRPKKKAAAVVVDMHRQVVYGSMTMQKVGKVYVPVVSQGSEDYRMDLFIQDCDKTVTIDVVRAVWFAHNINDTIEITYVTGRIWKNITIKEIHH